MFYTPEPILAMGMESFLEREVTQDFEGVLTIEGLITKARCRPPDVVLLEYTEGAGYAELKSIVDQLAGTKVVLWCSGIPLERASNAMGLGIKGVLMKNRPLEIVKQCLAKVCEGNLWFEAELTQRLLAMERISLNKREREVVALLAQGLKNKEIGQRLHLAESTVKVYLVKLYEKVGANGRLELALWGQEHIGDSDPGSIQAPNRLAIKPKVTRPPENLKGKSRAAGGRSS